jgi:ribosomal-protein-alanine N-acetyltransferase
MLYRLYEPGDFAQLYAVEESCFEPPFRFSRAYMRQIIRSHRSATWIAEEGTQLAGFAVVEWELRADEMTAYIETVEVAQGFRGQGVGAELMRRVEGSARAAGARTIWLHVDAENGSAIRLYERHGYERQGREEHYYARNRAAFTYSKALE